ncbi:hypothetical protein FC19_GL002256 [Liquorilactobacillus aquaticus DSM 21051]|uniref:ASCH domain-containing protein n=1 Tax=Liquorilactobacillus aquaticus DSM 21051 TaxID=1423725 RepID=A0A0R2D3H0_9LACO|nr:ASCH domain-containing protein [Liquorilactobacillus aquaticus]KRM95161.1 hypothetical protein FC19_GL002256 [Liquorilactobacillus aquaticus DSM 21051]
MDQQEIKRYWQSFAKSKHLADEEYSAYSFGYEESADNLASLVLKGTKTATTSAYELYTPDEKLPRVGQYNIVLDRQGNPTCITQTRVVEIIPFDLVSQEHAYHEGEGNRSLKYWRKVHIDFFKKEYSKVGKTFNEKIPCVCEVFEVVSE